MKKHKIQSNLIIIFSLLIILTSLLISSSLENECIITSDIQKKKEFNYISNNPISYSYVPHDPIDITSDSGFSAYSFPGVGSEADPYIIEGYIFSATVERPILSISITDTTNHFIIRNCYIDTNSHSGGFGIRILYAAEGTVSIINNTVIDSYHGIYVSGCSESLVTDNICLDNTYAIGIISSSGSVVVNNTCNKNGEGIELSKSSDSIVSGNVCENNTNWGIDIYGVTDNCLIYDNTIRFNGLHGITLHIDSSKNTVYRNTFIYNNEHGSSQAEDRGKRNKWYNSQTEEGNYWSDLGSLCKYEIDGRSNSKDLYPLNREVTCTNPKVGSTLGIVLPLVVLAAIGAFVVPKYVIPYHKEENILKRVVSFFIKNKILFIVLLACLFPVGAFVLFFGWYSYVWTGDINAALISGATICSLVVLIVLGLLIKKVTKSKKIDENI